MPRHRTVRGKQQHLPGGIEPGVGHLEIVIPTMDWEQIGGDMDPGTYGGTIATGDGDHLELIEIQPVREHVGDKEAADVGFPFWTKKGYFDLADLDPTSEDVKSALSSTGLEYEALEELDPEQRAVAIAEALLQYGIGDEGPAGWSGDINIPERVKWSSGTVAGPEYLADEDEEFRDDVLGYGEIKTALEEEVERLADMSSAEAWSTAGDQMASDIEDAGFDPKSIVIFAEFGDEGAVNGDLTDDTVAGLETKLEAEGYEYLDKFGGRVPSEEGFAHADTVIEAVAKELDLPEEQVKEAAESLDWWQEEIPRGTSGYTYVWAKRKSSVEASFTDAAARMMLAVPVGTEMSRAKALDLWRLGNNSGAGYAPYTDVPGEDTIEAAVAAAEQDGWELVYDRRTSDEIAVLRNADGEWMGIGGDAMGRQAWAVTLIDVRGRSGETKEARQSILRPRPAVRSAHRAVRHPPRPHYAGEVRDMPNIFWRDIPPGSKVELVGHSYVVTKPDGTKASAYWSGNDAAVAQRTLDSMAQASAKGQKLPLRKSSGRRTARENGDDDGEVPDEEDDEELDQSELDDGLVIGDARRGGYSVAFSGKSLGTFDDFDKALKVGVQAMHDSNYFPNIFYVNERGNVDLLSIKTKVIKGKVISVKYENVRSWV